MTSSPSRPARANGPPQIPALRERTFGHPGHTLIWVRTGKTWVLLDDGIEFRLTAGEGVWIPADGPDYREIVTEPGTVAFPYWPHADVGVDIGMVSTPTGFEVPTSWQDWLIQYFNLQITPLQGRGYSSDGLVNLFRRAEAVLPTPVRANSADSSMFEPPTMPKAPGARAVAEELARDPALDLTINEWATRVLSSPRTLLRGFVSGTGLTFEQWRLQCRLSAAVEFLCAGYDVDQVAARVGFSSRGGFTHAFKRKFGSTPSLLRRELISHTHLDAGSGLIGAARRADDLVKMVREGRTSHDAPELLPATQTPTHANETHVLSWVYRGSGYLDTTARRYERERGVATWIPAGIEHVTGLRQDSISLPVGDADTSDLSLADPLRVQFSREWDDYLMYCSIAARSGLRPDDYDPRHILDLFAEQVAVQRALSVPMPTDPLALTAAMDYLRHIGTPVGSTAFDVPTEVHRIFREQTGMTFALWCYAARMRIARDLLAGGAKPSSVSRRIGYGHLPNFSAAFTRFHGLSPRQYQERELGRP